MFDGAQTTFLEAGNLASSYWEPQFVVQVKRQTGDPDQ
jgi:hypothetical protein